MNMFTQVGCLSMFADASTLSYICCDHSHTQMCDADVREQVYDRDDGALCSTESIADCAKPFCSAIIATSFLRELFTFRFFSFDSNVLHVIRVIGS